MTIRETAIAKLQQLSEPLLQEVTDFIDFVIHKHQVKIARLLALMEQYRDRRMDLADATLVLTAEKTGYRQILTLDKTQIRLIYFR